MYIKHTRLPEIIVRFFVCLAVAGFAATITCGAAEKVEASPTPLVKAGNETADRSEMELAAKLVRLAARIPFIDSGTVVYQRPPMDARFFMDERERAAFDEFMALAEAADERQLWKLTAHPDPRTRTLAMIGTSWRGNPERLAGLHELTKDKAKTFPSLVYLGANMPSQQGPVEERRRKHGMTEQTVGEIAWQIVGAYLAIAQVPADQFHFAYWPARRDRNACLSWFELALRRATHGATPLQPGCLPAVRKLKERVLALKPGYRGWITLALWASPTWGNHDEDRSSFASDADIVSAAREIGAPALMRLFHGELESDDPDLRIGRHGPFAYAGVGRLVLRHAAEIFKAEEAGEMLALENFHRSWTNRDNSIVHPCWAIAAADLVPVRAREILLMAFERFKAIRGTPGQDMRCELAQALWKREQTAGVSVVKDWFFSETPEKSAYGFGRHRFAKWVAAPDHRRLLQSIVLDRRLEQLDAYTLVWLIVSANKSLGRTIISNRDLQDLNGYGSSLIERFGKEEAERREPVRMKDYQKLVAGILEQLRTAFPE